MAVRTVLVGRRAAETVGVAALALERRRAGRLARVPGRHLVGLGLDVPTACPVPASPHVAEAHGGDRRDDRGGRPRDRDPAPGDEEVGEVPVWRPGEHADGEARSRRLGVLAPAHRDPVLTQGAAAVIAQGHRGEPALGRRVAHELIGVAVLQQRVAPAGELAPGPDRAATDLVRRDGREGARRCGIVESRVGRPAEQRPVRTDAARAVNLRERAAAGGRRVHLVPARDRSVGPDGASIRQGDERAARHLRELEPPTAVVCRVPTRERVIDANAAVAAGAHGLEPALGCCRELGAPAHDLAVAAQGTGTPVVGADGLERAGRHEPVGRAPADEREIRLDGTRAFGADREQRERHVVLGRDRGEPLRRRGGRGAGGRPRGVRRRRGRRLRPVG